jgi:hypothetical protein
VNRRSLAQPSNAPTYTQHRLSDPALRRLSAICKGRKHGHGMALLGLENKGLVEARPLIDGSKPGTVRYVATEAGRQALGQARREGW